MEGDGARKLNLLGGGWSMACRVAEERGEAEEANRRSSSAAGWESKSVHKSVEVA